MGLRVNVFVVVKKKTSWILIQLTKCVHSLEIIAILMMQALPSMNMDYLSIYLGL